MADEISNICKLNLEATLAMLAVLVFRAWLELKNYRLMWKKSEWQEIYTTTGRLPKAEKDLSLRLRAAASCQMLQEIFKVDQK